ncbi:MAG: hypothetical protein JWM02_2089 [Frankiales bacterium]|nr:hypothetical protein [Frankiales bacterium]
MSPFEAQECADLACTRRRLLAGAATLAGLGALELASPRLAFASGEQRSDLLVVVSLRGGADGLSLVPPLSDPGYLTARPDIGVRPGQALQLDGVFGLHPGLRPLLPFWTDRRLAIVHAVGDSDGTRSHFEAMDAMERGVNAATAVSSGWVDRHLTARGLRVGDFPALAIGNRPPGSLQGPAPDLSVNSVRDVRVRVADKRRVPTEKALAEMYAGVAGPHADAARSTLDALRRFAPLRDHPYLPRVGVNYPTDSFGVGLRQIAQVARAGVGLQVATLDLGGWDTHEGMGDAAGGAMTQLVSRLGAGLAAFARDLGPLLATTTIVTMSEFGRRVWQNGSGGVDHGHGSAMLVLGGGIRGGKVYGRWSGLDASHLENGDLRVTTDYRDVLGELVQRRLGGGSLTTVFPDHRPRLLDLATQR